MVFHVRKLATRLATEVEKRVRTEAQLAHSARLVSLGRMAAEVTREALSFVENEASFRQVELVQQLDRDLPIIKSDPGVAALKGPCPRNHRVRNKIDASPSPRQRLQQRQQQQWL